MQNKLSSGSFLRFVGYQAQNEQRELIIFQPALLQCIRCLPKAFQGGKGVNGYLWAAVGFLGIFEVGSNVAISLVLKGQMQGL